MRNALTAAVLVIFSACTPETQEAGGRDRSGAVAVIGSSEVPGTSHVDLCERVLRHNILVRVVQTELREPPECEVTETQFYDGEMFGTASIEWNSGVRFEVQTFPVRSELMVLDLAPGVGQSQDWKQVAREVLRVAGSDVDWARDIDPASEVDHYEATAPGVNASVQIVRDSMGATRQVRIGFAA